MEETPLSLAAEWKFENGNVPANDPQLGPLMLDLGKLETCPSEIYLLKDIFALHSTYHPHNDPSIYF